MKKVIALFLFATILLTGCSTINTPTTKVKNVDGYELTIYEAENFIVYNEELYRYSIVDGALSIKYPTGAVCTEKDGAVSWSNADAEFIINNGAPYVDCYALLEVAPRTEYQRRDNTITGEQIMLIMISVFIILIGIFEAVYPEESWQLTHGWKYKNAEPSDMYMGMTRVGGVVMIIAGAVMLMASIFG